MRGAGPAITVHEIERTEHEGTAISASEVRRHLRAGDLDHIRALVPPATFDLLKEKYLPLVAAG